jgi:hypothetical protein
VTGSVHAQTVTTISDFHNFNFTFTYANWNEDGSSELNGGTGFTPTLTSGATEFNVVAQGYGSAVYDLPVPISAPGAIEVRLTFRLNSTAPSEWMGPNFDLHDGTHQVTYFGYNNYSGPGTYTVTAPVGDLDTTTITAFNLQFDPAAYGAGTPYDITFERLEVVTAVPEPASFALAGLSVAGLLIFRRRSR